MKSIITEGAGQTRGDQVNMQQSSFERYRTEPKEQGPREGMSRGNT
jgi:hypothetical protein